MAQVRIPEEQRTLTDDAAIAAFLAGHGITYERWPTERDILPGPPGPPGPPGASADAVLRAYAEEIAQLNARGGYTTADVLDVTAGTPNLDAMLAKFSREHRHSEDEVRFILEGRGVFHVHPPGGPVFAIEVGPGDLINVPSGTRHWFDLCAERRIRAIRLFRDPAGWAPLYTDSGVDAGFQPLCFGAVYVPREAP